MTETLPPPRRFWLRFAPLAAIILALTLAIVFRVDQHISFETLRRQRAALDAFIAAHLIEALMVYIAAYILIVAASLPLSIYLTFAGGYLFGAWLGFGAACLSGLIGATLVFLAARTALGNLLRKHAGPWLRRFEAGFRDNAFNYVLALRLTPIMPFWILNLAPAFFDMKLRDFVIATAIGIIPVTMLIASVGAALHAGLDASANPAQAIASALFSPLVLADFSAMIALALLPVALKRLRR